MRRHDARSSSPGHGEPHGGQGRWRRGGVRHHVTARGTAHLLDQIEASRLFERMCQRNDDILSRGLLGQTAHDAYRVVDVNFKFHLPRWLAG